MEFNYIINLDRRKDKFREVKNRVASSCLRYKDFTRFSAYDGTKFEEENKRFKIEEDPIIKLLKDNNVVIPKGVMGCTISHYLLLLEIMNNKNIKDDDYVGVFEDDFFLGSTYEKSFDEKFKEFEKIKLNDVNGSDIELLYLGGVYFPNFDIRNIKFNNLADDDNIFNYYEKTEHPNIFYRKNRIENILFDRATHAYIIRKNCCKKLIDIILKSFVEIQPIDSIYNFNFDKIKTYDYMPHLFYSLVNYKTDIQLENQNNKKTF